MRKLVILRHLHACGLAAALFVLPSSLVAQPTAPAPATDPSSKLFAVELKTGPRWVAGKPPPEQEHFREHSANLRMLREQGRLVLGARYSDKGFIVLAADSESAARAMMEQDPAIRNGIFSYELHPFAVFYGGSVQPQPRKPAG